MRRLRIAVDAYEIKIVAEDPPLARTFSTGEEGTDGRSKDAHKDLHTGHPSSEAPRAFSIQRRQPIPLSPFPGFGRGGGSSAVWSHIRRRRIWATKVGGSDLGYRRAFQSQ